MEPLASSLDVQERLGRALTATEELRVEALLKDASAKVRQVSGQQFTAGTSTSTLRISRNGEVRLPQRPVTDVSSVEDLDGHELEFAQIGDRLRINPVPLNIWELHYPFGYCPSHVVVEYDHGGTVPDVIVSVVCSMVARSLGTDPTEGGVTQRSIDGYSESFGSASATTTGMLASERETCEAFNFFALPIPT